MKQQKQLKLVKVIIAILETMKGGNVPLQTNETETSRPTKSKTNTLLCHLSD